MTQNIQDPPIALAVRRFLSFSRVSFLKQTCRKWRLIVCSVVMTVSIPWASHGAINAPTDFRTDAADFVDDGATSSIVIQLRWTDNATNETGYQMEVSSDGTNFALYTTLPANSTGWDNYRIPWTQVRWFRMRAVSATEQSSYTGVLRIVGNMPTTLLAGSTSASNQMRVTWSAAGGILTGYTVEQATDPAFSTGFVSYYVPGQTTQSFLITYPFALNTTYYFRVASTNATAAKGNSEFQNKPISYLEVAPNGPPTRPTYVAQYMDNSANESLILFDDASLNETAWWMQYSTDGGSTWKEKAVSRTGSTRYSVTFGSMTGGATYNMRLASSNSLGASSWTTWRFQAPKAPTGGPWTTYYVDASATGSVTGTNLANAWTDVGQINWPILKAGDTVYLRGGNYTNYIVTWKSGSVASPITIKTVAGEAVNIHGQVAWRSSNVTIDGAMDSSYNLLSAKDVTNNIGLHVFSNGTTEPVVNMYNAIGARLKWAELTDAGNPGVGEGDAAGIIYGYGAGPTNSEIAYCYIHDNFGNCILGNVNLGYNSLGNMAIHHNYLANWHNNMMGGLGASDIYNNYATGWKGPGVAHPDGFEGDFNNIRMFNNEFYNYAPPSGSGLYFSVSESGSAKGNVAVVNNIFVRDSGTMNNVLVGQSGNPANVTISNVVVAGNLFWSGDNYNNVVIQTGTDNNWQGRAITFANNVFWGGKNAAGGEFSSGKLRFPSESSFVFNYNLISGTDKSFFYRTNNVDASLGVNLFPNAQSFSAWSTSYKSNSSAAPYFASPTNHNFRMDGTDTNAVDRGVDLSSWATLIPAIANDITGVPRNQYGKWDIGPYEKDLSLRNYTVNVQVNGPGSGAVSSNPAGLSCGGNCSATFSSGTIVTLTATPTAGSAFSSWSGACSGTAPTCTLTVTGDSVVTATFSDKVSPPRGVKVLPVEP